MKVYIDRLGCIECGTCQNRCPAVFLLPEGERAVIVDKYRVGDPSRGEVGEDLVSCVQEAELYCPVAVICADGTLAGGEAVSQGVAPAPMTA